MKLPEVGQKIGITLSQASNPQRRKGRPKKEEEQVGPDQFVEATRQLLKTCNPGKVTQKAIAQVANADPRLLRYYFGSLDNLLVEVAHRYLNDLNSRMAAASVIDGATDQIIRRRMKTLLRFYVEEPNFWNVVMDKIYLSNDDRARTVRRDFNRNSLTRLSKIVERGLDRGEVTSGLDTRFMYVAMIGLAEIFASAKPIVDVLFSAYEQDTIVEEYGDFIAKIVTYGFSPRSTSS